MTLSRALSDRERSYRKPGGVAPKVVLPIMILAIGAVIGFWIRKDSSKAIAEKPNLILITMDTTRADHIGSHGHPARVTPHIDQIAREGVLFEQCMSSAPSTLPSHSSIMTSLHPFVHGARDNIGYRLSESNTTLAEVLRDHGYVTGAFVSALPLVRRSGIGQGFSTYEDSGEEHELLGGPNCDRAIRWLRDRASDQFFAWVHFYDPHFPYAAPSDFDSTAPNAYLREIAYMDSQIGRLMAELKLLNIYDNTIVVLVADHGEGLNQHNESTHCYFIYNTTIHVPMILCAPESITPNKRIRIPVQTVDLAPTLLDLINLPPLPVSQGTSLVSLLSGNKKDAGTRAYAETIAGYQTLGTSIIRSLRVGKWKYIHSPRAELYDLAVDPGELNNLAEKNPDQLQFMREELRGLIAESPQIEEAGDQSINMSAQDLARLESLGYVGGDQISLPASETEMDLFEPTGPDPKDFAGDIEILGEAQQQLLGRKFREAEASFKALSERLPDVLDLRKKHARAIMMQNRFEDALAIYEPLAADYPDDASVRYGYGKLLSKLGQRKKAITQFIATVQLDPEHSGACHDLAIALRDEGHTEEAEKYFRQAIRVRPTYTRAYINLARLFLGQEQYDEAIKVFRSAVEVSPDDPELHASVAFALMKAGQLEDAQVEAEAALTLDATHKPAQRIIAEIQKTKKTQSTKDD